MTDRIKALTVILERDNRDDDVRECCSRMIAAEDILRDLKQRNKP